MCENRSMAEQTFKPGEDVFLASDSPVHPHSACFEDDGETGYFYALDLNRSDSMIVDAVHIYNVANVTDRDRPSTLSIEWSVDGLKCALLINGYPHAAFDFSAKRGFCRTNFPNSPSTSPGCWPSSDHSWSDGAIGWLK
jgi:hypothetical protein